MKRNIFYRVTTAELCWKVKPSAPLLPPCQWMCDTKKDLDTLHFILSDADQLFAVPPPKQNRVRPQLTQNHRKERTLMSHIQEPLLTTKQQQ